MNQNLKKWLLFTVLILAVPFMTSCSMLCGDDCSDACCDEAPAMLCGGCGEIKGGDDCCAKDATVCTGCGLHKGSPGCCKMEKGTDVKICGCGAPAGSDACKENCAK